MELFKKVDSASTFDVCDDLFPFDGSHFRFQQLETIWALFGLAVPIVTANRMMGRIDELVEHRNAIAHGRATAEEVGRRFSVGDIEGRINDTQDIYIHLISSMQLHCSNAANLSR
jgi:hypothetical protein